MTDPCDRVGRVLGLYAEGELEDPVMVEAVRRHLRDCSGCRDRLERYDALTRALLAGDSKPTVEERDVDGVDGVEGASWWSRLERERRVEGVMQRLAAASRAGLPEASASLDVPSSGRSVAARLPPPPLRRRRGAHAWSRRRFDVPRAVRVACAAAAMVGVVLWLAQPPRDLPDSAIQVASGVVPATFARPAESAGEPLEAARTTELRWFLESLVGDAAGTGYRAALHGVAPPGRAVDWMPSTSSSLGESPVEWKVEVVLTGAPALEYGAADDLYLLALEGAEPAGEPLAEPPILSFLPLRAERGRRLETLRGRLGSGTTIPCTIIFYDSRQRLDLRPPWPARAWRGLERPVRGLPVPGLPPSLLEDWLGGGDTPVLERRF